MNLPNLQTLNSPSSILKSAWGYFQANFVIFLRFSTIVYFPLLFLTGLQIIIYLLKIKNIFSSLILDFLGFILSSITVVVSLAVDPILYAILITVFLQLLKQQNTDFQSVRTIFNRKLNNLIKSFVIYFLYFITVQQLIQIILLIPLSFGVIKQALDLETFFFAESITDKINSINLQQIINSLYPNTYYFTECVSMFVAVLFIKKYYFYIPIVILENVTQSIPLKNSKILVNEVKELATKLFLLSLLLPYLINLTTIIFFTNALGLTGTVSDILLNLSASKQISLFASGMINIFIYPTLVISTLLLYFKARLSTGETLENILSHYEENV